MRPAEKGYKKDRATQQLPALIRLRWIEAMIKVVSIGEKTVGVNKYGQVGRRLLQAPLHLSLNPEI